MICTFRNLHPFRLLKIELLAPSLRWHLHTSPELVGTWLTFWGWKCDLYLARWVWMEMDGEDYYDFYYESADIISLQDTVLRTPSINAQCRSMPINANQNCGIDTNADQFRSMPINWSALRGISDQCQDFDRHWSALGFDPRSPEFCRLIMQKTIGTCILYKIGCGVFIK